MENLCKGMMFGFAVGLCVGGIMVAKNKKLANKIKDGMNMAEEKIEEAKDMVKEKIEECQDNNCNNNEKPQGTNFGEEIKQFSTKNSKK